MSGGWAQGLGYAGAGTYGADRTQQFGGTIVSQSATANTKGAWQLIGTVSQDCTALLLKLSYLNANGSDTGVSMDVGIGPSGSQVVLIPDINMGQPSVVGGLTNLVTFQHIIPIQLPQGTSIWARAAVDIASSTCVLGAAFVPID